MAVFGSGIHETDLASPAFPSGAFLLAQRRLVVAVVVLIVWGRQSPQGNIRGIHGRRIPQKSGVVNREPRNCLEIPES
jgi:hypothetical protein